jgi:hypothetical protein
MEKMIEQLYDVLINEGIGKKNIETGKDNIHFVHKKIKYSVQIDGEDGTEIIQRGLIYGPDEFENQSLSSDYLHQHYQEYGNIDEFYNFVYDVVSGNTYSELYKITEKLLAIEADANNCGVDVDFERLVTHMFVFG